MQIGELAQQAGVTTKAVRYYESLGLLTPERLPNGYRDYGEHDVRIAREIRALSDLGLPVERTRPFLDCLAVGHRHADDCPASLAEYREAIDDLSQRIERLDVRQTALIAHLYEAAHRNSRVSPTHEGADLMTDYATLPPGLPVPVPVPVPVPEDDGAAAHLAGKPMPPLKLRSTGDTTVGLDAFGPGRTAYASVGIALPRTAQTQYIAGPRIAADQLQPETWSSSGAAQATSPTSDSSSRTVR